MSLLFRPIGTVITAIALPLAFAAFGLWQAQRADRELAEVDAWRARTAAQLAAMDARPGRAGGINPDWRFTRRGHIYEGDDARREAQAALRAADDEMMMARWCRHLAPVVTASGVIVAALGSLVLAAAFVLGRAGRRSREWLIAGFSLVQRVLPALLIGLVVVTTIGIIAAVIFETLALRASLVGLVAIGATLIIALAAVLQLRGTAGLHIPEPAVIAGRPVSVDEAPGLWQLTADLAARLGTAPPDAIVVGLTEGFFVAPGPNGLDGTDQTLAGNVLHVPLPHLALLQDDEIAAAIGHELAHFAGQDTAYGKRADPVHDGMLRSLDALVAAGTTRRGSISLLIQPALALAVFVTDQFYQAAQHWGRHAELAADAAGAAVVSAAAAARTLLRQEALRDLVEHTLDSAWTSPAKAPRDLVAAIIARAAKHGLNDPTGRLDDEMPHPADSHPPTRARLAALGQDLSPEMIAAVTAPPEPEAAARLGRYLADPDAITVEATARFVARARKAAREEDA